MSEPGRHGPGFIVFRQVSDGHWQCVGEVERRPGLPARAARRRAVLDVTHGAATPHETYAAVLRSEWRVALDVDVG